VHNGEPQGKWLSVEDLLADLAGKCVELTVGDSIVVHAPSETVPYTVQPKDRHLRIIK
jgi:hypothetical protein